ncbi:MAG: TlpA family protein disulfide reductase, partial [Flavobacteriales bacterium]|nr:TlpA family protein disulfide reductase [Flavobacteriales bacterium]
AKRPKGPEGFSDRFFFRLDFIDGAGAVLNRDIARYNERLDGFLANIYPLLKMQKSPKALADSLIGFRNRSTFEFTVTEGFISDHIKYSIGNLEQTFILKKKTLYERYMKDRPALLWNPEYMRFIEQFYEGVFARVALVEKRNECIASMKKSNAFSELEDLMRQQPFMDDASVRRTVMVRGMEELYGQKGFDPNRVTATLKAFAEASDSPVLAKAAINIAERRDRMRTGTPTPDFSLRDTDGKMHRPEDFKGNFLLLEVTEPDNAYCLQEAAVLRDMQKRFPSLRFLTVVVSNSAKQVADFKRDYAPARPVIAIGRNHAFMTDHAISSLPTFVIIGPDGRLYRSPALDPSKGGVSELEVLEQTGTGKRKVGGK